MVYFIDTSSFSDDFIEKIKRAESKTFKSKGRGKNHNESICARALLGYILYTRYGISSFSYRYGTDGKPYLENVKLYFNISHSGSGILCCVSDNEIGCDIEKVREYNPKVAKRFFTEKETGLLEASDVKNRLFARLWTLKESILKKDGSGIRGGLDTYCFADNAFNNEFYAYGCNFLAVSRVEYELTVCSTEKYSVTDVIALDYKDFEEYINKLNSEMY